MQVAARIISCALVVLSAPWLAVTASGQAQPPVGGAQSPTIPRGQAPVLGRPTQQTDPMPVLDFNTYFTGTWAFEWDVPDSVLGPGGTITGKTTYRQVGDRYYEAETEATGPSGPIRIKEVIAYLDDHKALSRQVTDSRGFSYLQMGGVGGDLGGYFNVHFASAPFSHKGSTIRLMNTLRLLSPVQYRNEAKISIDGGPERPFGNTWWKKIVPGVTGK